MRSPSPSWSFCLLLLGSCASASAHELDLRPRAWVLSPDPEASQAWLERAGFVALPLPLTGPPPELPGLLVLAAEASDTPEYHAYMRDHADELPAFVERGGVVLSLAQSAEAELAPPFLPPTLVANRGPLAGDTRLTFARHPLLAGLERADDWRIDGDGFVAHTGFTALVAHADGSATLLVGDHGRGQFLLAALPLDRPLDEASEASPLTDSFAANLAAHVACVQAGGSCGDSTP